MLQEFFIAVLKAGLPVALASYGLIWWALKNDHLGSAGRVKEAEKEIKRVAKERAGDKKKGKGKKGDPLHNKWLAFGGGFYGVVGLLTYAVVELGEIRDFFTQFDGLAGLIAQITPNLFIGLFIDALKNFIVAIAWPVYWMSDIRSDYIWIWFAVAYGGYWLGTRSALHQAQK